mmetsp:Transcript_30620/g.64139  ORF Transcript_30620/g.64139 Transcript_30620/m.64139 type:complete len:88 (+) Transcript_30620:1684-1947(+)
MVRAMLSMFAPLLVSGGPVIPMARRDCDKRKWHPITGQDGICTNAEAYPPLWDETLYSEKILSSSAEECCEEFYSGGICHKIYACEE